MDNQDRFNLELPLPELQLVEHEWSDPRAEIEHRRREAILAAEVLALLATTEADEDSKIAYLN